MTALASVALAAAAAWCLLGVRSGAGLRLETVVRGRPPGPSDRPRTASERVRAAAGRLRPGLVAVAVVAGGLLGGGADGAATAVVRSGAAAADRAAAGAVPALLLVGAAVAGVRVRRRQAVSAVRRQERARAMEACAALSAELRAGRSPADALLAAAHVASGPCRTALSTAAGAAALGGSAEVVLRAAADGQSGPGSGGPSAGRVEAVTAVPEVLHCLAACWAVCAGTGSGLAAAVERLEEGLRADGAQRRAVQAELAGPRATAALLAVLPAGGLLMAAGLGADPVRMLLTTPLGLACLTGGLLLDGVGLWWTGRLVERAGAGG